MSLFFRSLSFFSCILCVVTTVNVTAETLTQNKLEELRKVYLATENQHWNVNSKSYKKVVERLSEYPLLPYFQQKQLRRNLSLKNESKIDEFLTQYSEMPVSYKLRSQWLDHLYISNKPVRFLKYYKPNISNKLSCIFWQYKIDEGVKPAEFFDDVSKVWLSAKSQPKECDPIFKLWKEAGYQTIELTWQRFLMARQKRQYLLAKYLQKQLQKEEKYLVDIYHSIRVNPGVVAQLDRFKKRSMQESLVITYGLKRLVWRDEALALKVYQKAIKQQRLNDKQNKEVLSRLTVAAARSDDVTVERWYLGLSPAQISDAAKQWKLAKELSDKDYVNFLQQLEQSSPEKKQDRQWRYWQTRAKQLVNPNIDIIAEYASLGKERSYYGFLAAARMGENNHLNHKPLMINVAVTDKLKSDKFGQRAFELYAIANFTQARREWDFWLRNLTQNETLAAVKLAHNKGWHSQGIASLGRLGILDDMDIRFPIPHPTVFNKFAKQYKVDVAWAYAIARKESIFMSDARSSVGALGLMQLMPSTAKSLSHKKISAWNLLQVDTNVKLGISYLKILLNRFDNNIVLATAAYNAGPGNVNKWLKEQPKLPADEWIETIPFKETREYVKSVLAYTEIYQQKYGEGESPFKQLITMQID